VTNEVNQGFSLAGVFRFRKYSLLVSEGSSLCLPSAPQRQRLEPSLTKEIACETKNAGQNKRMPFSERLSYTLLPTGLPVFGISFFHFLPARLRARRAVKFAFAKSNSIA
jgi:hypothetical protein